MGGTFQNKQVYAVRAEENDDKTYDFRALLVGALEVPNAVHDIAVEAAGNETKKVRKFQIPVQDLVQYPDGGKGDQGVHYTDGVVFDKMFHGGKNTIFATI